MDYHKDCRADLGGYVEASTDKVVTNDNTPRTHACIALGPSGNRQGSLKCFDLKTGKLVVRRIAEQIPWPDRMLKVASEWGRKSKKLVMKDSVQFLNRKGEKFDWDNDEMSDLEVKTDPSKMIHPNISAELPGIELQRDRTNPSRVTVRSGPTPTKQAAASRISVGLDAPLVDSAATIGVNDAPVAESSDDANQKVESDNDEDEDGDLTRLTTEDDQSNSDSDGDGDGDDEEGDNGTSADAFDEDIVGDEEVTVPSPVVTLRGRVSRPPNNFVPTMTGKIHGNSRDQGVNFPLVGNYCPDNDMDSIDSQYAGAG